MLRYIPNRLRNAGANVERWGNDYTIRMYRLVTPLVALGTWAAWAGIWYELLRPGRHKLASLLAAPPGTRRKLSLTVKLTFRRA